MGKAASAPGTHDSTVYGTARASPQRYYPPHLAAISSRPSSVACRMRPRTPPSPTRRRRRPRRRRPHLHENPPINKQSTL